MRVTGSGRSAMVDKAIMVEEILQEGLMRDATGHRYDIAQA